MTVSEQAGFIELERSVESIMIGRRHRTDLGDLDALAASIEHGGLLQPPTITPDGVLVCGARRLAAIKKLGWKTVNVWVRSGISDRLGQLIAEQDDNTLHKPLTQREAAALYRELKQLMHEDAARRKAATQFSAENQPGGDGPAKLAGPSAGTLGTAREQAARLVTGRAAYTTLEKIGYLQRIADDPAQTEALREQVTAELDRIDTGAPVDPIYTRVCEVVTAAQTERETSLDEMAREALARVTATKPKKRTPRPAPAATGDVEPVRYPVRGFILTWGEMENWWTHYDVDELATRLTDEQIGSFLHTAEGTVAFAEQLRTARETQREQTMTARRHLRAL